MPVTNYGPNLQKLVDSKCIKVSRVRALTQDQLDAIEHLSHQEVSTLIKVFHEVGGTENMWMI